MEQERVKILFRFYSDILEEETVETMWAIPVDKSKGLYKLDNIPFYAKLIASDDIVLAEYGETELMLTYRKTIEHSGNSVVAVIMMEDATNINSIRDVFSKMGCISEKVNNVYFVMEILASTDYRLIKEELDTLEKLKILEYAEPCLSNIHQQQI